MTRFTGLTRWIATLGLLLCTSVARAAPPPAESVGKRAEEKFDVIIRGGSIIDGSGKPAFAADVGIIGDKIAKIGDLSAAHGEKKLDAKGLVVAPGLINMLSWANETLLANGLSQSDIRQGVTLEVFGEGWSMGPINEQMRADELQQQGDIKYPITWTTLREFLVALEKKGVACNVASFVGATTVRIHEIGHENRPPTPPELERMKALVRQAMEDGAMGVGSSLIYAPAFYANTDELIALCQVAAEFDGMYITHMRSEGNRLLESIDEVLTIAKKTGIRAEIYHFKAAGQANWNKQLSAVEKIEEARQMGLAITANMYPYTAGATGLNATMPPWAQEGGLKSWIERLRDPVTRGKILQEMRTPTDAWENLLIASGSPDNVLLVGFRSDALKPLSGKSLAQVAAERGLSAEETAMDLVIEDNSRVDAVFFMMDEENVRRALLIPWISFGSDAGSISPELPFLKFHPHPRAYGTFARVLGKYVREEKLIPLEHAIHRMTGLAADKLKISQRGRLQEGYFADVIVFDPLQVGDHATFEKPHQYATGMRHVWVNGQQVLSNGEHTGALPGRAVYGPGWKQGDKKVAR